VTARAAGRLLGAVLAVAVPATAGAAALVVKDEGGRVVAEAPLGPGGRWCLVWNHSVTGIEVTDCFRAEGGRMLLTSSHQPDFAAGLGHVPGRGVMRSDGDGGYLIEGIDAVLPEAGLVVRRGGEAVGHRIAVGGVERPLPGRQGERLVIRLEE
jgi:hypothetical protein